MIKILVVLSVAAFVYSRPIDQDTIHVVYPKMLSEISVAPPEPRSGVAYVYSIPITESPHQPTDIALPPVEMADGIGEVSPVNDTEITLKEVTVSKRVGFHKEGLVLGVKQISKDKQQSELPTDPLDPKVNES